MPLDKTYDPDLEDHAEDLEYNEIDEDDRPGPSRRANGNKAAGKRNGDVSSHERIG